MSRHRAEQIANKARFLGWAGWACYFGKEQTNKTKKGAKMKKVYILLQYACGNWQGCYSFGYFTNRKKALSYIDKLNQEQGTITYTIQTICKNEL